MALPVILSYTMPSVSELPKNKVSWKPDPKRIVLLIHDMQKYFIDAFTAGESPMIELLANIQLLKTQCAELGIPIIYTAQPGGQPTAQRGLQQDFWGPGMNDGPTQKKIVEELLPKESDILLTKWRYSAFQKTNLRDILLQQDRDQLIVCGVYAHIGCLMTACEAFMQDVEPFFVADAVADFTLEHHTMALTYAAERCAVTISTNRLLDQLKIAQEITTPKPATASECQLLTREQVREQVAELLLESPIDISDSDNLIRDWGLDSIRIMILVERWRRSGVEITFVDMAERPTLADWWELLSCPAEPLLPNIDYLAL